MVDMIKLRGKSYPITKMDLHLPEVSDVRMMYMRVDTGADIGGFALWDIELALLNNIEELDGKRIHIMPDGETYEDDTLGTDIIGAMTDANYWSANSMEYEDYFYGDILVDFRRIEGRIYRVHVEMTLTESEEEPEDLSPEDYNISATADFTVTVDEINPME